ncbi:hypothetical protein DYB31_011587 [Aphanomyces astaci]|uniref:PDZ domain-containing protein n=1 Tax=Aphanomyces astaci TaxID=112090 RepID=A0A397F1P5_APHAT|nr:hypothetical protein DYB31_011587 [Aphanomyces astaci]
MKKARKPLANSHKMARGAAIKVNPRATALRRASSCGSLPLLDEAILKDLLKNTTWAAALVHPPNAHEPESSDFPATKTASTKPIASTNQVEMDNNNDDNIIEKIDEIVEPEAVLAINDLTSTPNEENNYHDTCGDASFDSDIPELRVDSARQRGGTTLLDRHFTKHSLKKLFSLPSLVTTVLEKRKKPQTMPSVHRDNTSPTSRSGRVALLEGRPSSPLALLEDDMPQSPTHRNVPATWFNSHPAFNRCKFIVWRGGVPGFHVSYNNSGTSLVVDSISGPFAWTEGIRVGDYLESIGGMSVADMDPHAAMGMLRMSDIPTVLRLKSSSVVPSERFFVVLHDNEKLGVTFTSDGPQAIPVVNRITDRNDTLARCCGLGCGHVLVAINAQDTIAMGLTAAMQLLATVKKPATLEFRRLCPTLLTEPLPISIVPPTPTSMTQQRYSTFLSSRGTESSVAGLDRLSVAATTLDETRGEIFIVWRSGPLGLTFVECTDTGMPKVNRLTGKGRSPMIDRVQHGYTLLSINGSAVAPYMFDTTCAILAKTDKPCLLLFRPPPRPPQENKATPPWMDRTSTTSTTNNAMPCSSHKTSRPRIDRCYSRHALKAESQHLEYELLWEQAPLGLVFGTDDATPYIKRVKDDCTLHIKQHRSILLDALVAVNNMATSGMSASDLAAMLRSATFPTVLRFRMCPANAQAYATPATNTLTSPSNHAMPTPRDDLGKNDSKNLASMDTISDASSSDVLDDNDDDDFLGSISEDLDTMQKFARSFNVVWHGGDLGLTFEFCGGAVVVKRLLLQGCARRSNMVEVGDALASINGRRIPKDQAFKDTMVQLLELRKPVILGFERDEVITPNNHGQQKASRLVRNYEDDGDIFAQEERGAAEDKSIDTSTRL